MIVADTHAWLWWLMARTRLSARASDALHHDSVAISPITLYESAQLISRGRIEVDSPTDEWLRSAVRTSKTTVIAIDTDLALRAADLSRDVARDPADRLIVATALHLHAPLVTADRKIHAAGVVETIW